MKKYLLGLCMLSGLVCLAGCSNSLIKGPYGLLRDSNADIEKAYSVPPLRVPPGMKPVKSDPYYVVPGALDMGYVQPVSLLPPGRS